MADPSTRRTQLRVLVMGGIGSGKSTVAQMLGARGAVVVETDVIGHEVLEPGGRAHAAVAARWPQAVRNGRIDRRALAAIVFTDAEQLAELEAITHPLIEDEVKARADAAAPRPVVVEVPLTRLSLGPGWVRVFVDAALATRVRRAAARGFDEGDTRARAAAQPDREAWLAQADHVINNGGSIEELEEAVARLWRVLTSASAG